LAAFVLTGVLGTADELRWCRAIERCGAWRHTDVPGGLVEIAGHEDEDEESPQIEGTGAGVKDDQ